MFIPGCRCDRRDESFVELRFAHLRAQLLDLFSRAE